jgi:hypothetical protein
VDIDFSCKEAFHALKMLIQRDDVLYRSAGSPEGLGTLGVQDKRLRRGNLSGFLIEIRSHVSGNGNVT